jgi:hypothetical protein
MITERWTNVRGNGGAVLRHDRAGPMELAGNLDNPCPSRIMGLIRIGSTVARRRRV